MLEKKGSRKGIRSGIKTGPVNSLIEAYSMLIASAGHTSTHVWQSTHISLSIFALSFSMAMADAGHSLTQVSHPVHFLVSTTATKLFSLHRICWGKDKKRVSIVAPCFPSSQEILFHEPGENTTPYWSKYRENYFLRPRTSLIP